MYSNGIGHGIHVATWDRNVFASMHKRMHTYTQAYVNIDIQMLYKNIPGK